jgi:hypothetical protein
MIRSARKEFKADQLRQDGDIGDASDAFYQFS